MGEASLHTRIPINISITRQFYEGSGCQFTTSVYQDTSVDEINELSDKIMAVVARQEVWTRIARLNDEIEVHAKQRAQMLHATADLEKKHGDFSEAPDQTRMAYQQNQSGVLRTDILIGSLAEEQNRLRALLNSAEH